MPNTSPTPSSEDDLYPCGHAFRTLGCGGCDPGAIEFVVTDEGVVRPFDPITDMTGHIAGTRIEGEQL